MSLRTHAGWYVPAKDSKPMELMQYQDFQSLMKAGICSVTVNLPEEFGRADELELLIYYCDDAMLRPLEFPVNHRVSAMHYMHIYGDALLVMRKKDGELEIMAPNKWRHLVEECDFAPLVRAKLSLKQQAKEKEKCVVQ